VTERDVGQKKEQAELQRDIDQQDEYQYHRRRKKKNRGHPLTQTEQRRMSENGRYEESPQHKYQTEHGS
jgi:hypothetical protein